MKARFCLALYLKDDPHSISEYRKYHQAVWSEITRSIKAAGVEDLEIYLAGNRLFMVLEAGESFSWEAKSQADREILKSRSGSGSWTDFSNHCRRPSPVKNGC